jgi:hypothetical protein
MPIARTARKRRPKKRRPSLPYDSRDSATLLGELMRALAFALLARGMTSAGFTRLLRSALVEAAATRSKMRNGKVNHSRVAAQTGLTRAAVRRVLHRRQDGAMGPRLTPVENVIRGWQTDSQYSVRLGDPKRLPISGSKVSFAFLAKKYAGDVPYRAILEELRSIDAIEVVGERVRLRSSALRRRMDLSSLFSALPAVTEGLESSSPSAAYPSASIHRILIPAATEAELTSLRGRCASTAKSFLDTLDGPLEVRKARRDKLPARDAPYSLAVTVLLAVNSAKKAW